MYERRRYDVVVKYSGVHLTIFFYEQPPPSSSRHTRPSTHSHFPPAVRDVLFEHSSTKRLFIEKNNRRSRASSVVSVYEYDE